MTIGGRVRGINQGAGGGIWPPSLRCLRGPRAQWMAAAAVAVAFVCCWLSVGGPRPSETALPAFRPPPAAVAATPAPRTGLLPDCTELLPTSIDPAALLAQPSGSVAVHTVVGTPAPAVDLLARTSCTYHRVGSTKSSAGGSGTLSQVNLSAFATPAAAEIQRQRNIAAGGAGPGSTTAPVTLGAAHATLLTGPTATILMTSYDRYTITASLPPGLFPAGEASDVLIDLTRRALASTLDPAAASNPSPPATQALASG